MTPRSAAVLLVFAFATLAARAAEPEPDRLGLGFRLTQPEAALELPPAVDRAVPVVLPVAWSAVEPARGERDWSAFDAALARLVASGYRPAVALVGPAPAWAGAVVPSPLAGDSLDAWLDFARAAVRRSVGRTDSYRVWDGADAVSPDEYAYLLKATALAVRAEGAAAGRSVRVVQAPVGVGRTDWQRQVWERDAAAYVDVLPVVLPAGGDADDVLPWLREVLEQNLRHPPAAEVWAEVRGSTDPGAPAAALALAALAQGASVALLELDPAAAGAADLARWTIGADRLLEDGFAPAPLGTLRVEEADGRPLAGARPVARFFSDEDFLTLVFYVAPGTTGEGLPAERLIVDSPFARDASWIDPATGREVRVAGTAPEDEPRARSFRVGRAALPAALRFRTAPAVAGFELPEEAILTRGSRELTAEEVIARHQAVQKVQDDRLERWSADGRIDFHFKLAQGSATVDVRIASRYFWERGGEVEWEQTEYHVNGNRVRWKNIPELPLIQPEKVVTLPLDLTFDRTYAYRLVGREPLDGGDAYVLAFEPAAADPARALYRGRVWIDSATFVRRRVSVVQLGLEPPVISNEETTEYAPVRGPDGGEYWLAASTRGQQVWKTAGRSFVVLREGELLEIRVNPPPAEFAADRSRAYASGNQMLRDTDEGLRYLERQPDGTRTVKEHVDSSQVFLGVGAFGDSSTDGIQPLGGVNYFNYDFRRRGVQVNAFFAGVLGFFTASDPDFLGSDFDATLDATLSAIKFDDKVFVGDDELLAERLRTRAQNATFQLGRPFGAFAKLDLRVGVSHRQYFEDQDAAEFIARFNALPGNPRMLTFIAPPDHQLWTARLGGELNRRGYSFTAAVGLGRRSEWREWGLFDTAAGSFVSFDPATATIVDVPPPPVERRFTRWQATAFKEWYLPAFQKVRAEIDYLDGSRLDRFSRYEFSLFGDDRLNGFSGTGVRFDRGFIGRVGYSFNLFEAVRFDAVVENARVEERDAPEGMRSFTGVGVAGNVLGPWKSVVSLSYGYALASDIPDLEGEQEFLLLILKLF